MNIRRKKTRKLDLSGRNLTKFPTITTLDKKIRYLDLSNNNIEEIPANIGELKELKYLYLNNNRISQLHNGILKAESLQCLYLYGNPMKKIPNFIKKSVNFSIITDNYIFHYNPEVEKDGNHLNMQREISDEVDCICCHDTTFARTAIVPSVEDPDITFNRHGDRKGKELNTCVLFVDIRGSVQKNDKHRTKVLVNMYSSFVYGVLKITRAYNGHVRNIIGDRIMVVFDEVNCCDNAVGCAGAIHYFCNNKMSSILPNDSFRCGIGIHYGEMSVIEVGLQVPGKENSDYKNLIWIGEPANLASRLTDKAGKNNIPFVVISKGVYEGLTDRSLKHGFNEVNKRLFKNIDFKVLGCNLIVK